MTEQYPFFRESDERTLAVIGEKAVISDLSGTYKKPYAVLTQKRLYCKNEMGNFITGYDKILHAGHQKNAPQWLLWAAFGLDVLSVIYYFIRFLNSIRYMRSNSDIFALFLYLLLIPCSGVILFLIFREKLPKAAPIILCLCSYIVVLPFVVILVVIYFILGGKGKWFEICCTTSTFTFSTKLYPAAEFRNFAAQVKVLTEKTNGK